jgi:hypothetical protein
MDYMLAEIAWLAVPLAPLAPFLVLLALSKGGGE